MRNPYIVGPYVTGRRFYGRQTLLDYLLHGASPAYWIIGGRRVGKTSLLRHLEFLAQSDTRLLPVFWDLQGCDTFKQLGQYLADAINECSEQFLALGLAATALAQEDALTLLPRLRRAAHKAGREVLLLCDETEPLLKIAQGAPKSMQRLHGELTAGNGLRTVVVSTQATYELHEICSKWPTSSFLGGFDMSQTLGSLASQEARRLVLQGQEMEPVRAKPDVIERISECTNDHPYLIQLLCSRLFEEDGCLRAPTEDDLQTDPILCGFFAVDFGLLALGDRRLIVAVAEAQRADTLLLQTRLQMPPAEVSQRVHNLIRLGYLRRAGGQIILGNHFLANWLAGEPNIASLLADKPVAVSETAMQVALAGQQAQESNFLRSQLNAHRARLVELEAIRARDLLQVSPQVLAEIEQHQFHIKHLLRAAQEGESALTEY